MKCPKCGGQMTETVNRIKTKDGKIKVITKYVCLNLKCGEKK